MGSIATSNGEKKVPAVQKLRNMLADPEKFIACPGIYDGFTARIALREGVDCLYMVSHTLLLPPFLTNRTTTADKSLPDWRRHDNVSSRRG